MPIYFLSNGNPVVWKKSNDELFDAIYSDKFDESRRVNVGPITAEQPEIRKGTLNKSNPMNLD